MYTILRMMKWNNNTSTNIISSIQYILFPIHGPIYINLNLQQQPLNYSHLWPLILCSLAEKFYIKVVKINVNPIKRAPTFCTALRMFPLLMIDTGKKNILLWCNSGHPFEITCLNTLIVYLKVLIESIWSITRCIQIS